MTGKGVKRKACEGGRGEAAACKIKPICQGQARPLLCAAASGMVLASSGAWQMAGESEWVVSRHDSLTASQPFSIMTA
jgi:hypothetical protein